MTNVEKFPCILLLLFAIQTAYAAPASSWTPPPDKFSSDEWRTNTPSWSKPRNERGGTVVWFYKEMTQEEALPVMLRTLDDGETWLQTKAVQELETFSTPFPKGFEDKLVSFYDSIRLDKLPAETKAFSEVDRDRMSLKIELLALLCKVDPAKGRAIGQVLGQEAPQENIRIVAKKLLEQLKLNEDGRH